MTDGNKYDEHYEVGYKKPPKEHQFKKGQSGNPKGRPKKSDLNAANLIEEELLKIYRLTVDGAVKEMPAVQVMTKAIMSKAMQGDVKAAQFLKSYVNEAVRKGKLRDQRQAQSESEDLLKQFSDLIDQIDDAKRANIDCDEDSEC